MQNNNQGWECPKCFVIYSPFITFCNGCSPKQPLINHPEIAKSGKNYTEIDLLKAEYRVLSSLNINPKSTTKTNLAINKKMAELLNNIEKQQK